jgi:hypothetical protein
MPKRCPPGVICFENVTIAIIVLFILISLTFFIFYLKHVRQTGEADLKRQTGGADLMRKPMVIPSIFNFSSVFTRPNDVLLNPYEPPLRDDSYMRMPPMPINIPTQSIDTNYRQIGILTRLNGPEMILPLMGRPLFTNRDKWNFYTMSDKNNMIKLPVSNKGRSCTNEYGCDNLYNGDTVYVEGYNDAFKVTSYDNAMMRYLPNIL